jgi:hypothetical protein
LIAVDEADGIHWRVGYNNFYVITRYNHSALYAMAVYELAGAVKQRVLENDAAQLATSASPGHASPTPSSPMPSSPMPSSPAPASSTTAPQATTPPPTTP